MPIISVIIPVYNGEETIEETIFSVLNQTFLDFELIIINADSSDATLSVIKKFSDPRIQVFSYPRANVAVNRNRGASHACGEFLSFIDADDLWTQDKLAMQHQALLDNPNAAVVYSWTDCIDEEGKFLRRTSYASWTGDVYCQLLIDNFISSGSNIMVRRNAFDSVNGFETSLTNSQDIDLCIRLASLYDFTVVPKPQIKYRILKSSMSSDILGLEKSRLVIIDRAFSHPKAINLQHLRRYTLGNIYKYFSYKALDVAPGKQNTIQALRVILYSFYYDFSFIFKPIFWKALIKLLIISSLPPTLAVKTLTLLPKVADTSTFLGYKKSII